MKGFVINIEKETLANEDFRRVLYTARNCQLVLMSLKPGEEIGMEVHHLDQFLRFEGGEGKAILDGIEYSISDGSAVIVPAGTEHNFINTSATEDLKLYTIYAPPEHKDGIVRHTKEEAESNEEHWEGETSEKE
ncbi:MAG: cupin domain-containing protein [Candidatus Paceibacterota bacterium]|jgi:mannose-6-phosphate isomerase-like protein (cupin superfamily)|nr:cupin domain-containing protein [Candidatus Paceibacterota bacterium]